MGKTAENNAFYEEQKLKGDLAELREEMELNMNPEGLRGEFEGWEKDGISTWDESGGAWGFLQHYRWNINFFTVGLPYIVIMFACLIWNLVMNIAWFKGWAGGNFWLLGQTFFLINQILVSIPLVFELDFLITHLKPVRLWVFTTSFIYNSFYLTSLIWGLVLVFNTDDEEIDKYDLITIISVLAFFFDVATNIATFVINSCIITKELSLEVF